MIKSKSWSTAYLGLGSNLGHGPSYLLNAIKLLKNDKLIVIKKISSIYQSSPVDNTKQPIFTNAAIKVKTLYSPMSLLKVCQAIEKRNDRVHLYRWGPRSLDIDILSYDQVVLNTDILCLPHPEIINRDFVIEPLLEIAPLLTLPTYGLLKNIPLPKKNII